MSISTIQAMLRPRKSPTPLRQLILDEEAAASRSTKRFESKGSEWPWGRAAARSTVAAAAVAVAHSRRHAPSGKPSTPSTAASSTMSTNDPAVIKSFEAPSLLGLLDRTCRRSHAGMEKAVVRFTDRSHEVCASVEASMSIPGEISERRVRACIARAVRAAERAQLCSVGLVERGFRQYVHHPAIHCTAVGAGICGMNDGALPRLRRPYLPPERSPA